MAKIARRLGARADPEISPGKPKGMHRRTYERLLAAWHEAAALSAPATTIVPWYWVADGVVMRFDHVYEVDPALMTKHTPQQDLPAWETRRIVDSRWEHLRWMQDHWADGVISGQELLDEADAEERAP